MRDFDAVYRGADAVAGAPRAGAGEVSAGDTAAQALATVTVLEQVLPWQGLPSAGQGLEHGGSA